MDPMTKEQTAPADETSQVSATSDEGVTQASPLDDQPASSPGQTDGSTDPEPSSDEPKSLEEAVMRALDGDPGAKPADPKGAVKPDDTAGDDDEDADTSSEDDDAAEAEGKAKPDPDPDQSEDDDKGELPDPSDEELKSYRPQIRRRMNQLLSQRQAARREVESLKPAAEQYKSIRSFMSQNDLTDPEVADLFRLGADLKSGSPERLQAFLEKVTPFVQMAQEALGQSIPEDLQSMVDAGEMTDQVAKELARQRRTAELAQTRATRQEERSREAEQARQAADRQAAVNTALQAWTSQKAAADPDFARKQDAMKVIAQGLVAERGLPKTAEDAVRYAEDAYKLVGGVSAPVRQPTRPSPSTSASSSRSGVTPAPTSLEDIVKQGLNLTG
jgi:hypothetical protein